jgi:CRISPR-associated exonuclease Cas4
MEFCERRAALHLIESVWEDNAFTAGGTVLHEHAHEAGTPEKRGDLIIARSLAIHSFRLGLVGKADIVEFHRTTEGDRAGVPVPGLPGRWRVYPVEYKPGRLKEQRSFQIQLCAQAMCLEEMLRVPVDEGSLFYGKSHRRTAVRFDDALRDETEHLAVRMHELFAAGVTPPGVYEKKCKSCSLFDICRPEKIQSGHSAAGFLSRQLAELEPDEP